MISIIVPIYKAEKTLPQCIESILAQTYTDFELLLIDDGSPDYCGKICDEYAEKDNRIRVFHNENGGVSKARNCGMDNMRGEYFVCVDSDDVVKPCHLEDLIRVKTEHPELAHVLCGFYCVSQKRDYIYTPHEELTVVDRKDYMSLSENVLIQSPWLQLYSAELVNSRHLRMREDLSLAEDLLFNLGYLDALENTSIGVINKANYIYQDENTGSLYHRYNENQLERTRTVNEAIKGYLTKWGVSDEAAWQSYNAAVLHSYFAVLENTMNSQNPMTEQEKIEYNSSVLKEKSFIEALNNSSSGIKPRLKKACLSGDYKKVLAAKRISDIKNALHSALKL